VILDLQYPKLLQPRNGVARSYGGDGDVRSNVTSRWVAHASATALIAGGGSGIGRGCALRLAGMGYHVVLVGRSAQKLDETARRLPIWVGATAFQADVRDWDRLGELQAMIGHQGIDLLINSAGGQFAKPSAELSRDGWQSVVDVNLSGSFFLCRQLLPSCACGAGSRPDRRQYVAPAGAPSGSFGRGEAGVVNLMNTLALEWASTASASMPWRRV
jgi:NAD(P)-dependent dehydrogenase (short-subunit alcohol dehydrogenase family)